VSAPEQSDHPLTVLSLLNQTAERLASRCPETPRLDAEVLLAHVLATDKVGLYLSFHNPVSSEAQSQLQALVQRRLKGEPVSYLIGRKEFWSLLFKVGPAVMVPRPQTETLVEEALKLFPSHSSPVVLDIGTGSGALAIALATELPHATLIATDICAETLAMARKNAASNRIMTITFLQGDLFAPVEGSGAAFDLIVSNPPYIAHDAIAALPAGIRDYEPHVALDGGPDGLACYRRIVAEAPRYLKPGGWLLLEVGEGQSQPLIKLISQNTMFGAPETAHDLLHIERVVKAQRRHQ
jgi:release factor glutamine methyltransferase